MGYALRHDLHFAVVDDRVLFLDIAADRYFRLPESLEQAFRNLTDGGEELPDRRAVERLCSIGILVAHESDGVPTMCRIATARSEVVPNARTPLTDVMHSLCRQMTASGLHTCRPLRFMIRDLARKKRNCLKRGALPDRTLLTRIASAFERSNAIVSIHERCLIKSYALAQSLLAHGQVVDLVFGVQARPFAAHCWVQADDVVLNDTPDHVRTFTPIFSV